MLLFGLFVILRGIHNLENNSVETISEYELKKMEQEVFHNFSGQLIDNASVDDILLLSI